MREGDLCKAILSRAYETRQVFPLLHLLEAYDQVLAAYHLSPDTPEATTVYRILLRWGRDQNPDWWAKFHREFDSGSSGLTVQDLEGSSKGPTPSFDEKVRATQNATLFFQAKNSLKDAGAFSFGVDDMKTQKLQLDSLPSRETPLSTFTFSLPKFREFLRHNKSLSDAQLIATAFHEQRLKSLAMYCLKEEKDIQAHKHFQVKVAEGLATRSRTSMVTKAWLQAATSSKQDKLAKLHYEEKLTKRCLEMWTQLALVKFKTRLSKAIARKYVCQRYFRYWKHGNEAKKLHAVKIFTAEFKYKQWILKKCLIGFNRHLQSSLKTKIYETTLQKNHSKSLKRQILNGWKSVQFRKNLTKQLYLKGYQRSYRFNLKFGWRKFTLGVEKLGIEKALMTVADAHFRENGRVKMCIYALERLRNGVKMTKRRENSLHLSQISKKRAFINYLREITKLNRKSDKSMVKTMKSKRKMTILKAWKQYFDHQNTQISGLNPVFLYAAYRWLTCFSLSSRSLQSTNSLESDRSRGAIQYPLVFLRDINKTQGTLSVEKSLQTWFKSRILVTWKRFSKQFRHKRKQYRLKHVKPLFAAWKVTIHTLTWHRFQLSKLLHRKNVQKSAQILRVWNKYSTHKNTVNRIYSGVLTSKTGNLTISTWTKWRSLYLTIVKHRSETKLSNNLYKSKYLGKCLIEWRNRLRNQVKKRRLKHTGEKFEFLRLLTSGWKTWRNRYITSLELNLTSEQLVMNKEAAFIAKIFSSWQRLVPILRNNTHKRDLSRVKYNRKLAKRTLTALFSYAAYEKHKQSVYQTALHRFSVVTMRNCLLALQFYSEFRRQQRQKDSEIVPQIRKMRKNIRFQQWYKHALLYSSCRYLPELIILLHKKVFFRKLEEYNEHQQLADAYAQVKQEKSVQSAVLRGWFEYVRKRGRLEEAERSFCVRERYYRRLVPFKRWRKAFAYEKNCLRLFYKGVLQLKHDYLQECMCSWKLYRGYRLRKKYTSTHRHLVLTRQSFTTWRKFVTKKHTLARLCKLAQTEIVKQNERRIFYTWFTSAIKKQKSYYNYWEIVKNRTRKVMLVWKKEFLWRQKEGETMENVAKFSELQRKRRGIRELKAFADRKNRQFQIIRNAKKRRNETLKRISFQQFVNFQTKMMTQKQIYGKIHENQTEKTLKKYYLEWKKVAEPAINRVISMRKLLFLYLKVQLRVSLHQFSSAVKIDIDSDLKMTEIRRNVIKNNVFKALKLKIERNERKRGLFEKAENLYVKLQFRRTVFHLQNRKSRKIVLTERENKAKTHYEAHLFDLSFRIWTHFIASKRIKNDKFAIARSFRLHQLIPTLLNSWRLKISENLLKHKNRKIASSHYRSGILSKSIQAFRRWKILNANKREIKSAVQGVYSERLKAKSFHQMRQYGSAKVSEKGRRQHFSFQISSTHSRILTAKVFEGLKINRKNEEEKVNVWNRRYRRRGLKRCFVNWNQILHRKKKELFMCRTFNAKLSKNVKKTHFVYWRNQRILAFKLKKFQLKLKRRTINQNFNEWKRALGLKFMQLRKDFAYKLAAFQTLGKYSQVSIQAQAILQGVREKLEREFKEKVVLKWKNNANLVKKTRTIRKNTKSIYMKTAFSELKRFGIRMKKLKFCKQKLAEKRQKFGFMVWRIEQIRHANQVEKLGELVASSAISWKQQSIKAWKKAASALKAWEAATRFIIEPRQIRILSEVFLAWKLSIRHKKTLESIYERYIEGKIYQQKLSLFQQFAALRSEKRQKEAVIMGKDYTHSMRISRKIVHKWRAFAGKKVALGDLEVMVKRMCVVRRLKGALSKWELKWRNRENQKTFREKTNAKLMKKCMELWEKKTSKKQNVRLVGKILMKNEKANIVIAMRKWGKSVKELSDLNTKADALQTQFTLKAKRNAFQSLCKVVTRKQRHSMVESHLNVNRAYRVFRLFRHGCRMSREQTVFTLTALEHHRKRLLLSSLVGWRVWMQQRFEAHVEADKGDLKASEHHSHHLQLKAFLGWAGEAREATYIQTRSRSYAIFSAWKVHTKEMGLLKKYLQECNMSDRYMQSSRDVQESSRSSVFATLRSLGSSGTTTRELTELSTERPG